MNLQFNSSGGMAFHTCPKDVVLPGEIYNFSSERLEKWWEYYEGVIKGKHSDFQMN